MWNRQPCAASDRPPARDGPTIHGNPASVRSIVGPSLAGGLPGLRTNLFLLPGRRAAWPAVADGISSPHLFTHHHKGLLAWIEDEAGVQVAPAETLIEAARTGVADFGGEQRSEEHTSELQ